MSKRDELMSAPFQGQEFESKLPKFGYKFDEKTGERVFCQIGIVDQQANIQSELETCDYTLLMSEFTSTMSDFDFDEFLDEAPSFDKSNPLSLITARENLQIAYQGLPKEVKAKYENNSRKFADAIIGGEFGDLFASWQPVKENNKTSKPVSYEDLVEKVDRLAADVDGMQKGSLEYSDGSTVSADGDKGVGE